jgi:hypothetical protein
MWVPNCSSYPFGFVDVGEDSIMADDVATPSNPPVAPVQKKELKETPFDVNVS